MFSFLKNKNNHPGKDIPEEQICIEDLEKLMVRGSLFAVHPYDNNSSGQQQAQDENTTGLTTLCCF